MPFSSTPVYVGLGDQVEVRYPTPSTWNTQVTVQVRIGTGSDPDGITFGTRIPDSSPDQFTFNDQSGSTDPAATSTGQFTNTFQKATTYYSSEILVTGIELEIPAVVSCTTTGPKGNTTGQNAAAAFRINRGGVIGSWQTSGNVREGDLIRLRATTENWYTTNTNVTLTLSDETWGTNVGRPSAVVSDTWSITTRAQDQNIDQYLFTDYVDIQANEFGGYKTQTIPISGIDNDTVLRATSTNNLQISKDNVTWSKSVTGLVLGDNLYTRIPIVTYTTKKTGNLDIFAVGGDTKTGGYETNSAVTFGSGTFAVTQSLGTVTDNWQIWTEVDRYPDSFTLSPIYAVSDEDEVIVTSTNVLNDAEPGFVYYTDFLISGLGVEYPTGTYSNLESPSSPSFSNSISTTDVNNSDVQLLCTVSQGSAEIRKNNTGTWEQQLYVKNGDEVNVRLNSSTNFNTTVSSTIRLVGPPSGGPLGNPTAGPSSPSFSDKSDVITIKTRLARSTPYPFRAKDIFDAFPGFTYVDIIPISGLDISAAAQVVDSLSSPGTNAQISLDGISYSKSLTVPSTAEFIYVRATASTNYNTLSNVVYQVGAYQDTFKIFTRQDTYIYDSFSGDGANTFIEYLLPDHAENIDFILVGAGGGAGGDDVPNSFGGVGGFGNILKGRITLSSTLLADQTTRTLKIFAPNYGSPGESFIAGGLGGVGGFGYAVGGRGGSAGAADRSGSGGGGGGAAAITLKDGTLLALAGGGAGGGGAGNDTTIPNATQNGNNSGNGSISTSLTGLLLSGSDGGNNTTQGGGGGGGGGGYGIGGTINTQKIDEFGGTIQSSDLDGNGGSGGGGYRNPTYTTLATIDSFSNYGANSEEAGYVIISYPPQDLTPNPFVFLQIDEATPNTTYESEKVSITGITGNVSVSLTGSNAQVRICDVDGLNCSSYELTGIVRNNQTIQIKSTTGENYYTPYTTQVTVGTVSQLFTIVTGAPPDTNPTPFSIPSKVNQSISTLIESDSVLIGGINTTVSITASNGAEISICTEGICDNFLASPRTISNGQSFKVRLLSSSSYDTSVETSVKVGDSASVVWTVRTIKEPDTTPLNFLFTDLFGQPLNTTVFSDIRTIQGIDATTAITVSGGALLIKNNNIDNPILPVDDLVTSTVENFDTIQLEYTTSNIVGESKDIDVVVGTYSTTWTVANTGQLGTSPTPFIFTPVIATGKSVLTPSTETITIAGLGTTVSVFATNNAQIKIGSAGYQTYTFDNPGIISNGNTLRVRIRSSEISGFSTNTNVYVGSYNTLFTVTTPAPTAEPILGQWYSSPSVIKEVSGNQIKYATKFDGLAIGTIMPVFKDNTQVDQWGVSEDKLNGKADSRFPGWIYCDGRYVSSADFPALYNLFSDNGTNSPVYGSNISGEFRIPDFRNRKLLGTGVVDGNSPSSPVVSPQYGPTKLSGTGTSSIPGSFGGMWYIDTIADPGVDELEQVYTPGEGLPAQESPFFSVAQITTTGYLDVSDSIEFLTGGQVNGSVSLKETKIYDIPFHQHFLVTGQADAGDFKGRVAWNSYGGIPNGANIGPKTSSFAFPPTERNFGINMWGYPLNTNTGSNTYIMTAEDAIDSNISADYGPVWVARPGEFNDCDDYPNLIGNFLDPDIPPGQSAMTYFCGILIVSDGGGDCGRPKAAYNYSQVNVSNPNYDVIRGEIGNFINTNYQLPGTLPSDSVSGNNLEWIGAITIPRKSISIQKFTPTTRRSHSHYVSLSAITDKINNFSYGNEDAQGTRTAGTPDTTSVNVVFTADQVGLDVFPGTFVLGQGKQLIPTPIFSPNDKVPLLTPYTQVRWMIKAY